MEGSCCDGIASLDHQSASEASYNKKQVLPLTRHLKRLMAYTTAAIDKRRRHCQSAIINEKRHDTVHFSGRPTDTLAVVENEFMGCVIAESQHPCF